MIRQPGVDRRDLRREDGIGGSGFHHELLLYSGEEGFLAGTLPFIDEALSRGEPVLVAVGNARIELLKGVLAQGGEGVEFADMHVLGSNPARIIPAWRRLFDERAPDGRPVRAIGEPIWHGRSPAELSECERHESLLSVAFDDHPCSVLCPYDLDALEESVIQAARESHPIIAQEGGCRTSEDFIATRHPPDPFAGALPAPASQPEEMAFARGQLGAVRGFASRIASEALEGARVQDLVLALNELATNSIRHAGGRGTLRIWREGATLLCEVGDEGRISEPLVGRTQPAARQRTGRGLWLVHHLCDLVQIRSSSSGSVVRVHMHGASSEPGRTLRSPS
jgi:anti-sigma regulatory factor (Ser/Thr protein kinase)